MKVESELFLVAPKETDALSLKKLDQDDEILAAVVLLETALAQSNQVAGKKLYRQTVEEMKQFLGEISELYGVYDRAANRLIAMLAVEEDSIERIAVDNSFQRRGIGAALMRFAQENLSANYVDIYADNRPALHFFESCGLSMFDETAPEPGDLMAADPHKIIHLMY